VSVAIQPDPPGAVAAIEEADRLEGDAREDALRAAAAGWPTSLEAWAGLGECALNRDDPVAAYAFFRTGYHRGLDRLRGAGWRGSGPAPWSEPSNRGFLRSLHGLMRAASDIGEGVEARRCREFLLELDPDDHFGVGQIRPADLGRGARD